MRMGRGGAGGRGAGGAARVAAARGRRAARVVARAARGRRAGGAGGGAGGARAARGQAEAFQSARSALECFGPTGMIQCTIMMNNTMTSDARAIAADLAARFGERAIVHDRDGTFPLENYADLHESGYLRLVIPPEYGGAGADLPTMCRAQARLAQGDAGTALAVSMLVQLLGRVAEDRSWPAPLFADICTTIARDGGLINSIVTEPELGSISRGGLPATTATPVAGGMLLNGHKIFATGAPALRYMLVMASIPAHEAAPRGERLTAIIPAATPGVRIAENWGDGLAMRTSGSHDVYLDDAFVPDAWVLSRQPVAEAPAAPPGANGWGLTVSAVYLGIGQAALAAACDYANTRVPPSLGAPIATLPHIQQTIGQMQLQLTAAETVLEHAARRWMADPAGRSSMGALLASAKMLATNAACSASEAALRVGGGFSLTRDLPLERHFRDARAGLFNPPQDDLALTIIGKAALAERG